jgi:4-amino-4-deoxy-L-arabinose transferase-like glycosyltransferase
LDGKFLFKKPSTKDVKCNVLILGQVIKIVVFLKGLSILFFLFSLFIVRSMHFTKIHTSKIDFKSLFLMQNMKIHAQFNEELFFLYLFIQVKKFNAYLIQNFVVILCSFFKYTNMAIKLFILSYFDLMSNCTNQKREGSNIVLNQNGVWMSHKLTQIHKTHHALNLEKINIVLTIIWYILCNFLKTNFPRTPRCC